MATHPIHIEHDQSDFDRHVEEAIALLGDESHSGQGQSPAAWEEGTASREGAGSSDQEGGADPTAHSGTDTAASVESLP